MELKDVQCQVLAQAIGELERIAGAHARVIQPPRSGNVGGVDTLIELRLNEGSQRFIVEVRNVDRRIAIAQIKARLLGLINDRYNGCLPLLVAAFVTPDLAEECRRLRLSFLDTFGNLYIHTRSYLADVRGKVRPDRTVEDAYRASKPTGLKITFALLCRPELAGAPYREIARVARVALGAVGPVLRDLIQREYIREGRGTRTLIRKRELLHEWVTYFPAILRPSLHLQRYEADRALLVQIDPARFQACWGGEYAAEELTRYLKAERFTIYVHGVPAPALMIKGRMRRAVHGNTEVLQAFWHRELLENPGSTVPPLLIYADLMATTDPRNLEAAEEIHGKYIDPTLTPR